MRWSLLRLGTRRGWRWLRGSPTGDRRLFLKLTDAQPLGGPRLTRQAITKHLRVLERARIVHGVRAGRERMFELDPKPIDELKEYLERVSEQWDQALGRLKAFVEE